MDQLPFAGVDSTYQNASTKLMIRLNGGDRPSTAPPRIRLPIDPAVNEIANAGKDCNVFEWTEFLESEHDKEMEKISNSLLFAEKNRNIRLNERSKTCQVFSKVEQKNQSYKELLNELASTKSNISKKLQNNLSPQAVKLFSYNRKHFQTSSSSTSSSNQKHQKKKLNNLPKMYDSENRSKLLESIKSLSNPTKLLKIKKTENKVDKKKKDNEEKQKQKIILQNKNKNENSVECKVNRTLVSPTPSHSSFILQNLHQVSEKVSKEREKVPMTPQSNSQIRANLSRDLYEVEQSIEIVEAEKNHPSIMSSPIHISGASRAVHAAVSLNTKYKEKKLEQTMSSMQSTSSPPPTPSSPSSSSVLFESHNKKQQQSSSPHRNQSYMSLNSPSTRRDRSLSNLQNNSNNFSNSNFSIFSNSNSTAYFAAQSQQQQQNAISNFKTKHITVLSPPKKLYQKTNSNSNNNNGMTPPSSANVSPVTTPKNNSMNHQQGQVQWQLQQGQSPGQSPGQSHFTKNGLSGSHQFQSSSFSNPSSPSSSSLVRRESGRIGSATSPHRRINSQSPRRMNSHSPQHTQSQGVLKPIGKKKNTPHNKNTETFSTTSLYATTSLTSTPLTTKQTQNKPNSSSTHVFTPIPPSSSSSSSSSTSSFSNINTRKSNVISPNQQHRSYKTPTKQGKEGEEEGGGVIDTMIDGPLSPPPKIVITNSSYQHEIKDNIDHVIDRTSVQNNNNVNNINNNKRRSSISERRQFNVPSLSSHNTSDRGIGERAKSAPTKNFAKGLDS